LAFRAFSFFDHALEQVAAVSFIKIDGFLRVHQYLVVN